MRPNKQQMHGVVYFLRWATPGGPIKIGFTKISVRRRLVQLKQSSPYDIEWLGFFRGTYLDERAAHRKFHQYRLRGEWFEPHANILSFIEEKCPNFDPASSADIDFVHPRKGAALDVELGGVSA